MTVPRLSVVMPLHNGRRWLDTALASLPSGRNGVEVIIRDSTPKPDCRDLIAKHAERLTIDYKWLPHAVSWTHKTNLGVEAATAAHACTLHQDDVWLADRFEHFEESLARHPDAVLYLKPSLIIDADGKTLGKWSLPLSEGKTDSTALRDALLIQNFIAIPAPIFRREAYLDAGGLDETLWYTPDWDLWLKLAARGPVSCDARPGTAFRVHPDSLTMRGDRVEFAQQLSIVLERHLPSGSENGRLCRASVRVNCLLARASDGHPLSALIALIEVLALGPRGTLRYLHFSRIFERVWPRLIMRMKTRARCAAA